MAMGRAEVRTIVERALPDLLANLGLGHWDVKVTYGHIGDDGACPVKGRCTRHVDYDQASVEIDPEGHDDEADLIRTLRHELFHVVLAPYDLYTFAVDEADLPKPMNAVLDRVWRHACEKAVINLERLHAGLTAAPPDRASAGRDAYRDAFRDAFVAYLKAGHGKTGAEALADAERVIAETDRRIADESHGDRRIAFVKVDES